MALYPGAQWRGPVPNQTTDGMTGYMFVVLHIMEGTLKGTDAWFHDATSKVSAHFGVGKDGTVYQWVDTRDEAWAQAGGNPVGISIQHEGSVPDGLTPQQIAADGKLLAWIFSTHGTPLQITDDPVQGTGIIGHSDGGAAWGGDSLCPGTNIMGQRQAMIDAAAPQVSVVSPSLGLPGGGTAVTVTGTGFTGATSIAFGTAGASNMVVVSDYEITAVSPAGSGTVDVRITGPTGMSPVTLSDKFIYSTGTPTITSVSPSSGDLHGGTIVVITGSGLALVSELTFGSTPCITFNVDSDTQITALTPPGTGSVMLGFTTPTVCGTSGTLTFIYTPSVALPQITSVTPITGSTDGGTSVVITGSGFTGVVALSFGAIPAGSFIINNDTQITATSPASAAGTVDLSVTGLSGTSTASQMDRFTFEPPPPAVTSVAPNSGQQAGGIIVTVTGSGFTGATSVDFGAVDAPAFTVATDKLITVTSPAGSGTVDVTVIGPSGISATSAVDQFTYMAAHSTPVIQSINPATGNAGTSIVITGSGFTGATEVNFGSIAATSFTVDSDAQITATCPIGASTVNVTVTTPFGHSTTNVADLFSYV